jgi:hypothetical protein
MAPQLGFDLSAYQGARGMPGPRWQQLKDKGVKFVAIRASVGTSKDIAFDANLALARKYGLLSTAYAYQVPGDPIAQADVFTRVAGDLPLWHDVEDNGLSRGQVTAFARRAAHNKPKSFLGVYSSASKWRAITGNMDATELYDACWNALWPGGMNSGENLPDTEPKPRWGGFRDALWWQWGPLRLKHGIVDGNAHYGSWADMLTTFGKIDPKPLKERPNYRKAYNATVDAMLQAALSAPTPEGGAPAWLAGVADARKDVADALDGLDLADPAA